MSRRMSRAEAARITAQLERMGDTFTTIAGHPGWYRAHIPGPEAWPGSSKWTCSLDDNEAALARAFAARASRPEGAAE